MQHLIPGHLPPVGTTLTREQLVAGLRCVFQRTGGELAEEGDHQRRYLFFIAGVLDDVAREFGLSAGEREEILGEMARQIEGV